MPDPRDVPVTELLHKIVSALADRPEFLSIKAMPTEDGVAFTVDAHPDDRGKLIGRQGRNAKSIRTLLSAAGAKLRRHYTVVINQENLQ